ncbi:MAG: RDD family protein [Acidimicrobiales bacterium]
MAYCPVCGSEEAPGQNFCARCGSATSPTGASTLTPAPAYQEAPLLQGAVAGFWWRVLAFVLDEVILDLALYLSLRDVNLTFLGQAIVAVVANFLYFGLMVGLAKGQTLGMMLCRMRVVNASDRGAVTLTQALVRSALYSVLLLVASVYHYKAKRSSHLTTKQAEVVLRHGVIYLGLSVPHFLDLLWAAWDKQRQTLHDKFAKTVVIRTR